MDDTVTSAEPRKPTDLRSRTKRFVGLVVLACCTLGASYMAGLFYARAGLAQLKAQHDSERLILQSNQERLTKALEAEKRLSLTLEARRNLDQAITALDARNFGIAEQQIKKAARLLAAAGAQAKLGELTQAFASFRLVATEDLGPQRKQLVDWVSQIDPLIVAPSP
jgi:hypothetical protein